MERLNDHRLSGIVLILAFISFAIGGTLPVMGEKGSMRIFTLPAREQLLAVAENVIVWRWGIYLWHVQRVETQCGGQQVNNYP
jgi:hypothetical protein